MSHRSGSSSRHDVVVVGVDGSADAERALRYAVEDALRGHRRIRLVHVVPETMPLTSMMPLFGADTLETVGRRILADAESLVLELSQGSIEVETALAHGPRYGAILGQTRDAALVVVGRRPSMIARIRTGSTSTATAARAECPVVAVPEEWSHAPRHGRVIAAIDGSAASTEVMLAGLKAAQERSAELVVLHAWRPMAPYDSALAGGRAAETWQRQAEPMVWAMLAGLRADFPDVQVQVELHYERTADALVAAGRGADLLVMGRRGEGSAIGLALGAKPRALLRAGVCPVQILPVPRPERQTLGRRAETGVQGVLRRAR